MAAHPPRRRGRRRRHPLGGVRAGPLARAHHRGRRARRLLQAGREPAVPRPRRRHRPRQAGGRARRARIGDPVARELSQRAERPVRPHRPPAARPGSSHGGGAHRGHARGVRRVGAGRHPERSVVRGARRSARTARAVDRAPEPARVRHLGVLPGVRLDARVPELQRLAHRAPRGAQGPLPLLQPLDGAAEDLRELRRPVPGADRVRHRTGRGGDRREVSRDSRHARGPRHDPQARRDRRRCCRDSPPGRSTCSSARR